MREQEVFIVQSGSSQCVTCSYVSKLCTANLRAQDQRQCPRDAHHDLCLQGWKLQKDHRYPLSLCGPTTCVLTEYEAVMPYFPYSRQSKKKTHRGAITARMVANLMKVAGVDHVITIDLHATQMQGFFKCPVDNLRAEPLIAKWIKMNIPDWQEAVVVSKNPGGTKRVTSLADALQLSFGVVTTDRRRPHASTSMYNSAIFEPIGTDGTNDRDALNREAEDDADFLEAYTPERRNGVQDHANNNHRSPRINGFSHPRRPDRPRAMTASARHRLLNGDTPSSPLSISQRANSIDPEDVTSAPLPALQRIVTTPGVRQPSHDDDGYEESGEDDNDEVCEDVLRIGNLC